MSSLSSKRAVVVAVATLSVYGAHAQAVVLISQFNPGLGQLVGIGFDSASGNVFIHPAFNASIFEFTPAGGQVNTIARPGNGSNDFDLDFAPVAVNIGGTVVNAGTLLTMNGDDFPETLYGQNSGTGAILANVALPSVSAVGGSYHAARNTYFTVDFTGVGPGP